MDTTNSIKIWIKSSNPGIILSTGVTIEINSSINEKRLTIMIISGGLVVSNTQHSTKGDPKYYI